VDKIDDKSFQFIYPLGSNVDKNPADGLLSLIEKRSSKNNPITRSY
jgi:hypothetical protein